MVFAELPVGNIFETQEGLFVKVMEPRDQNALRCSGYGLFGLKRLVQVHKKVEDFVGNPSERLEKISRVEYGTIVSPPHRSLFLLVTNGISTRGIVVGLLGDRYRILDSQPVKDLGYAGEYFGLQEVV